MTLLGKLLQNDIVLPPAIPVHLSESGAAYFVGLAIRTRVDVNSVCGMFTKDISLRSPAFWIRAANAGTGNERRRDLSDSDHVVLVERLAGERQEIRTLVGHVI